MRLWHLLLGTVAVAALVLAFAMRRAADADPEPIADAAPPVAHLEYPSAPVGAAPERPDAWLRAPVKAQRLHLGRPTPASRPPARSRSATAPPAPAGSEPMPSIPDEPPIPEPTAPSFPGDDGSDPCASIPTLDECLDRPTAGSMAACLDARANLEYYCSGGS